MDSNTLLPTFSVYCDESCHLENDHFPVMLLGAVWCPTRDVKRISRDILEMKIRHGAAGELKWTKVSPNKQDFYVELVKYFFGERALHFRALVVKDKDRLNHEYFNQGSHDTFYYKMYFYLLRQILERQNRYRIYLDIKDTRSAGKVSLLNNVLLNDMGDFNGETIERIQSVRSHESALVQLADFLLGAVGYTHRIQMTSQAKFGVAKMISAEVGCNLMTSTPPWENKFNLFVFSPAEVP